ncbi:hypothetical protein RJ639_015063 [Escallonia herrerae]|uniref:Alcohol dehydrogenase-like N-terminal domain-containing protein n=1 Tax=Escallonia herrerae TaxID=1293975 RepID=A0AA89AP47_9ASTE|nr:hypothetical protein RJ639_015063 [Escallonia herrerae]
MNTGEGIEAATAEATSAETEDGGALGDAAALTSLVPCSRRRRRNNKYRRTVVTGSMVALGDGGTLVVGTGGERHELIGIVTEIGSKFQKFKVGDKVGVGCRVESCLFCNNCADDLENYCPKRVLRYANDLENYCPKVIQTYNEVDYYGTITDRGYSAIMVANERFMVQWPENMPPNASAYEQGITKDVTNTAT